MEVSECLRAVSWPLKPCGHTLRIGSTNAQAQCSKGGNDHGLHLVFPIVVPSPGGMSGFLNNSSMSLARWIDNGASRY